MQLRELLKKAAITSMNTVLDLIVKAWVQYLLVKTLKRRKMSSLPVLRNTLQLTLNLWIIAVVETEVPDINPVRELRVAWVSMKALKSMSPTAFQEMFQINKLKVARDQHLVTATTRSKTPLKNRLEIQSQRIVKTIQMISSKVQLVMQSKALKS